MSDEMREDSLGPLRLKHPVNENEVSAAMRQRICAAEFAREYICEVFAAGDGPGRDDIVSALESLDIEGAVRVATLDAEEKQARLSDHLLAIIREPRP